MAKFNRYRSRSRRRFKPFKRFRQKMFKKRVWRAVTARADKKTKLYEDLSRDTDSGGLFHIVNDIPLGTGQAERVGSKIQGRYLKFRVSFNVNSQTDIFCRVIVARARTTGLGSVDLPLSSITQLVDKNKWEVLWERSKVLNSVSDAEGGRVIMWGTVKFFKTCTYKVTDTAPVTNPLVIFLWTNDNVIPLPTSSLNYQFSYNDI